MSSVKEMHSHPEFEITCWPLEYRAQGGNVRQKSGCNSSFGKWWTGCANDDEPAVYPWPLCPSGGLHLKLGSQGGGSSHAEVSISPTST